MYNESEASVKAVLIQAALLSSSANQVTKSSNDVF